MKKINWLLSITYIMLALCSIPFLEAQNCDWIYQNLDSETTYEIDDNG